MATQKPYKPAVSVTIPGTATTFEFKAGVLDGFPEAALFMKYLLERPSGRPVSHATVVLYATFVARLRRQGKLHRPDQIVHVNARTAANAFHKWKHDMYWRAVRDLQDVFSAALTEKDIMLLRRSSLVHPYEGKSIVQPINPITGLREAVACNEWTLHVPRGPVPPHHDPCTECRTIVLTGEQVAAIATAFERAWGTRDAFWTMAPELPLFGDVPPEDQLEQPRDVRACALSGFTLTSDAIARAKGSVTEDVHEFMRLLGQGVDGVYLSRESCGAQLDDVLGAIRVAWGA